MASKSKNTDGAQNQHYVPKFILRNFLSNEDKEQVTVFDKETGRSFTPNIKGIMAERRFNEFVIDDKWLASFEPSICQMEDKVLPVYRRVVESRRLENTEEERAYLAYLIAFQMVRTKAQRDRFTQVDNMVREKWSGIPEIDAELVEMDDPATLKLRHADFIENALVEFTGLIAKKDFLLMEAPAHRVFYLGDNPVAMFNHEPAHPFWGNIGLAIRGVEIYLPLTKDLMLCAWCPSIIERHRAENDNKLAEYRSALLGKLLRGEMTKDAVRAANERMSELAKPITDLIASVDNGAPIPLGDGEMDFHNSLQMRASVRHVICPRGDFALAERFMADNPGHQGIQIKAS
jgi:hypothetical protein